MLADICCLIGVDLTRICPRPDSTVFSIFINSLMLEQKTTELTVLPGWMGMQVFCRTIPDLKLITNR